MDFPTVSLLVSVLVVVATLLIRCCRARVVVIGGNAGAKMAVEIFRMNGYFVAGVMDNHVKDWGKIKAPPNLGSNFMDESCLNMLRRRGVQYFIATGDNKMRLAHFQQLIEFVGKRPLNCIHPSATIARSATLGSGIFINAKVVIDVCASVGDCALLNPHAYVSHDCLVDCFAQLGPNVMLCGYINIGRGAFLGTSCVVLPHLSVGVDAEVAAGSTVSTNLADGAVRLRDREEIIEVSTKVETVAVALETGSVAKIIVDHTAALLGIDRQTVADSIHKPIEGLGLNSVSLANLQQLLQMHFRVSVPLGVLRQCVTLQDIVRQFEALI